MPQPFEDTAGVERLLDDVGAWSLQEDVAQWLTKLSTVPADILDVATAAEDSWTRHFVVAHYNKMTDLEGLHIDKFGHRRLLLLAAQELRRAVQVASDRPTPLGPRGVGDFTVALSPTSSTGSGPGIAGPAYSACVPQ
ncbi:mfsd2ab, partial [Symbiodinium natans]